MALKPKQRAGAELRAQAEAIRAELLDAAKEFTADEVKAKTEGMNALLARAAVAEGITPDAEIEDQGGDALIRAATPENAEGRADERTTPEFQVRYDRLRTAVRKHFGGVNGYIRAMAGQVEHLSAAQRAVMQEAKTLTRSVIVGASGDASGGEFLLPLQQVESIFKVDNRVSGILAGARQYPVTGRTIRIPYVKQTAASNTRPLSGIAAVSIVDEGNTMPEAEPTFLQRLLTVYGYKAISKLGDETIADDMTGQLSPTVSDMVGGEVLNQMDFHCTYSGTGTAMPLGALHSNNAALLTVTRKTATQLSTDDIFAMYERHTHGPRSRWLISRRVLSKLMALTLGNNTLVTWLPNLQGKPGMSLLGYPVEICDFLPTFGSAKDIALVNPEFYAAAIRQQLTMESSIHVEFTKGLTTYRFIARGGGIPIPDGTYAYQSDGTTKVDEHSPFVTLSA